VSEALTEIRRATEADAPFLAWAILTAARSHLARGWFDIVLDRPETVCLDFLARLAATQARSWWHWSRFHVAEVAGERAATLCAFRAGEGYPLSADAMNEAFEQCGWREGERNAAWARGSYVFTCTFEEAESAPAASVASAPRAPRDIHRRG
jgi:hypothetical protein